MAKKKKSLNFSPKLKFKKPSKKLTYLKTNHLMFNSTAISFGSFAVQAAENGFMTKNQIETLRVAFRRPSKKYPYSKVWVLIKPSTIITKRSSETRMGKGKGSPLAQIALIHKGQILYEIQGPPQSVMESIFKKAHKKLPVKSVLVLCNK